ncbi:MAG: GNAT family N-acetyltransferase [Agarilytica sp.]
MDIKLDNLRHPDVISLVMEHLRCMADTSPPESRHALDLNKLRDASITFWTCWHHSTLAGCIALKEVSPSHGELKSMKTANTCLRMGVGRKLLEHLITESKKRGYTQLSLETGSMSYFEPARALYTRFGFKVCSPFAHYHEDPNSVYMNLEL